MSTFEMFHDEAKKSDTGEVLEDFPLPQRFEKYADGSKPTAMDRLRLMAV